MRDHVMNIFNRDSLLVQNRDIDQIHRLGKFKHQGQNPRPVIIRFSSVRIRMEVWDKRKTLNDNSDGNRMIVTEDFPMEWQDRRKTLWPIVKRAREMKKPDGSFYRAFLRKDQLMLDNRAYKVENVADLPFVLQPATIYTPMNDEMVLFFTKNSPLSNHNRVGFTLDGVMYNCSEQYIMRQKCILAGDT